MVSPDGRRRLEIDRAAQVHARPAADAVSDRHLQVHKGRRQPHTEAEALQDLLVTQSLLAITAIPQSAYTTTRRRSGP